MISTMQALCCRCLVHLTASCDDSFVLIDIRRLMVSAQGNHLLASSWTQHCSTISNICSVADITHDQNDNSTRSWSLYNCHRSSSLILRLAHLQEPCLSFCKPSLNSLLRLPREAFLFNDKVVEIVSEEFSASTASMAIVYPKERASGPHFLLSMLRLDDIQNDRHSILIIVPLNTLMCVSRVTRNQAMSFGSEFCLFKVF